MLAPLLLISAAIAQEQDQGKADALAAALRKSWDSFRSIEVEAETTYRDEKGNRAAEFFEVEHSFAYEKGGRYAFIELADIPPKGRVEIINSREDGTRLFRILQGQGETPGAIRNVQVAPKRNSADRYAGEISTIVLAWMPSLSPLHLKIGTEGTEVESLAEGKAVVVSTGINGRKFRAVLDEKHDWLPSSVEFLDGKYSLQVTQFREDNGRWFPAEGTGFRLASTTKALIPFRFKVKALRINRDIKPEVFEVPIVPEGTMVQDLLQNLRYTTEAPIRP